MSVKIIKSNTFEHAFVGVLRELKLNVTDGRNVVIVPDKFSLSLERNILSKLNITGSFNIEVMSFTRFAQKSLKNKILRCLTPEGSVMLLSRAITSVRDELAFYGAASYERGFPHEMYAVLTSIRNSGISADALQEAANVFPDGEMRKKLTDISLIYSEYMKLLSGTHSDSSTRLMTFAEAVPELDGIDKTNVYICDFF
jgi:ATP-dependent nuclease, subunit B